MRINLYQYHSKSIFFSYMCFASARCFLSIVMVMLLTMAQTSADNHQHYENLRATGWSPQKHFSKNHHIGYYQNHLKDFTCLDSCFCGLSSKFSPKDHGHPDNRTWRWAYRAAAALFGICKNAPIASKLAKSRFFFFFAKKHDFRFALRFFFHIFSYCFWFLCFILVLESKLAKSQKMQTPSIFFVFWYFFLTFYFHVFLIFLCFFLAQFLNQKKTFSNYFRMIFESRKQCSIYFESIFDFLWMRQVFFNLFSNLKHLLVLFSPLPVRLPQSFLRLWQDLLQQAKSHVLGTFRDDGTNLIRFR